jgi:hypothetical protein
MEAIDAELQQFLENDLNRHISKNIDDLGDVSAILKDIEEGPSVLNCDSRYGIYELQTNSLRIDTANFKQGNKSISTQLTNTHNLIKKMLDCYKQNIFYYNSLIKQIQEDMVIIQQMMCAYKTLYENVVKHFINDTILNNQIMNYSAVCAIFTILVQNFHSLHTYNVNPNLYNLMSNKQLITHGIGCKDNITMIVYALQPILK